MPEGPEIRLEADKISEAICGRTIEEVYFSQPALKRFRTKLVGRVALKVKTRGKAMLTRFDNGLTLYTHNQLYGRWFVRRRGELPNTNRTLRVALHTQSMSALLYSASEIRVLTDEEVSAHPYLSRLGPDILDESLNWRDFYTRLSDPRFARRSLGALFLDQTFAAGLGNYLRSEILHRARLLPTVNPGSLSRGEKCRLARATVSLSRRAYTTRGVTNPANLVNKLKKNGAGRSQYRFAVFGRNGQPCFACGTEISRIEIAGRRLYYCQSCQQF